MQTVKEKVRNLEGELISLRRDFHMHPELGFEEYRTSEIVKKYLEDLGLEVSIIAKTGVVGLLRGKNEGKTLMLRADMDALPQDEDTGLEYASKNQGVMHACGHDGHTAMLLVAAKILSGYKEEINGNIKFIFQPNEEEAGALDMIKDGVMEDPKVDAALAIHLWSPIPSGYVGLTEGPIMAALEEFELEIYGKAGHTGSPHTAIDPILAASNIIQGLQSIQTREIDPLKPITIMVGSIKGGSARNVIADKVKIGGTIRFLFEDEEEEKRLLLEKFERLVKGLCQAMNVDYKINYIPSNSALLNHKDMVEYVREASIETFGVNDNFMKYRSMAGEDFSEYSQLTPSMLYFLGVGNEEKNTHYPHHHPKFNIDEDILKYGVEMHVRSALNFLNKK